MAQFHETVGGRKFFDADVPRALKALEGLQKAVEQLVKAAQPVAPAPAPNIAVRENKAKAASLAMQVWHKDGEIEIDDDAEVSVSLDHEGNPRGAYVQAWVYVEFTANKETP